MLESVISDQFSNDPNIAFKQISDLGYRYVELHNIYNKTIEECNDEEIDELILLLKKYNLKVSNIASTIFFMCPLKDEYQISLFNDEFHAINGGIETHLNYLKNACKIANRLNCSNIRIFPFRYPDNEDITIAGSDDDICLIAIYIKQACDIAREYGITLCLENCPYSHTPKGAMTLKILKMCNCDNLKLLWDPANSYRAEVKQVPAQYLDLNLNDEFELVKDYIGHIHLKNYHYDPLQTKPFVHVSLNKGDIDYDYLIPKLRELNIPLSLEAEVNSEEELIESCEYLKAV